MIENTTIYDKKAFLALNRLVGKTIWRWRLRVRRAVFLFLGALCLLLCLPILMIGVAGLYRSKIVLGLLYLAWGGGLLVLGGILLVRGVRFYQYLVRIGQKGMMEGSSQTRYCFAPEEIVEEISNGLKGSYPYHCIQAVYSFQGYEFLQVDKHHFLIVQKDGFTTGTLEEFEAMIAERTGKPILSMK